MQVVILVCVSFRVAVSLMIRQQGVQQDSPAVKWGFNEHWISADSGRLER